MVYKVLVLVVTEEILVQVVTRVLQVLLEVKAHKADKAPL
jgi:hypothetical protein